MPIEKRKVQKTGGSSLVVTLPKRWVNQVGLKEKSEVTLSTQKSGVLSLYAVSFDKSKHCSVLNVDELSPDMAKRELIAHYVSGAEEIGIVSSNQMNSKVRVAIRKRIRLLLGMEIIDESAERILVRNILDPAKFSIRQTVEQMFVMSASMLDDTWQALKDADKHLAKDVVARDFEMDKLYLAVLRQYRSLLEDRITEEDIDMSRSELAYLRNVTAQLERIADHATKIADTFASVRNLKPSPRRIARMAKAADDVSLLIKTTAKSVVNRDKIMAHHIIDRAMQAEESCRSGQSRRNHTILCVIIEDSLDRMRGYITNIAEETIDYCVTQKK